MKFFKLGLVFAFVFLFIAACTQGTTTTQNANTANKPVEPVVNKAPATPADELAAAKGIFQKDCAKCHKEDGSGGYAEIDGEKFKVPSFKAEKVMALPDEKYIKVITDGDDEMPSFKATLKPEEIKDLVKLIRKEFQGK